MADLVTVDIESKLLPRIHWAYDPEAPSAPAGDGPWLLRWLRPRITVRHPFGEVVKAPWGEPGESTWPLVLVVPLVLLVSVVALWWRLRRRRK